MVERVLRLLKSHEKTMFLVAGLVAFGFPASGQTSASAPQNAPVKPLAYEVVSIKPHQARGGGWRSMDDGFVADGTTVEGLVLGAYGIVMPAQITGLPAWARSNMYDVEAKMDEATVEALKKLPPRERREERDRMMQGLLADRFQLEVHRETKELPIYELVIAKGGLKLRAALPAEPSEERITVAGGMTVHAMAIDTLIFAFSGAVDRLIVDKTGLTGKYDFTLKWTPDGQQETADSGPDLFAALEEQLGLKLVPAKGLVDTIVVDHVERPSPN